MRDPDFRAEQVAGVRAAHIAPVNDLVDSIVDLSAGLWAPDVAPMYGGTDARLLSVLRDPGPKTNTEHGSSGFLCMENDDATAERLSGLFAHAGIPASKVVAWNIYPWYINAAPTVAQLDAGLEPLPQLIELMPRLTVVMLHGTSAHAGWRRFTRRHPDEADRLTVIATHHTSRQAFFHPDPAEWARRAAHLNDAFAAAAAALAPTGNPTTDDRRPTTDDRRPRIRPACHRGGNSTRGRHLHRPVPPPQGPARPARCPPTHRHDAEPAVPTLDAPLTRRATRVVGGKPSDV